MFEIPYTFRVRDCFVGWTTDGTRVVADAALSVDEREWQTIEHKPVTAPVGLHLAEAAEVLRVVRPAPGFTLAEVHELGRIGQRWHMNTLHSACVHMEVPEGKNTSELLDMGLTCPETGYKFGSAWLIDELPSEVVERFKELASKGEVRPLKD
jgi:hypothetical protein